jgi:adenylate cyclase
MERRLTAILVADVAVYSRLLRADQGGTLRRVKALIGEPAEPLIARNQGHTVNRMGDGVFAEFASVVDAVHAATRIQRTRCQGRWGQSDEARVAFRVGANLGDMVFDGGKLVPTIAKG